MQLKFFLYIAVIFFLSLPVGATLTAPSTNHAGYKVWGNYWDMQGEAGVQNGYFIGIFNITDPTGHSYLKNNTFFCGSNTTCTYNANGSISISSIAGSSGGVTMEQVNTSANLYNINASNLTTGTIPSSVYGTGIYVGNISDYFSNLTSQGFVTNSTMDKNLSNGTGILPSSAYGTGIYAANVSDFNATVNATMDRNLGNYSGVLPNASIPASAANITKGMINPVNGTLYDVKAFGAVGNNIADDHAALQSAADFVSTAGTSRCMYFSPGIYNISKQINFTNNVCIQGSTGASIISANNITAFYINTTNQIYYPVISGDGMQFLFWRTDTAGRTGTTAIKIEGSNYFTRGTIQGITCRGSFYCIYINQSPATGAEIMFDHNTIFNIKTDNYGSSSTNYSIYFRSGSGTGNNIFGNLFIFYESGIYYAGTNLSHNIGDVAITGNKFYGQTNSYSIYMNGNASYRANNMIIGNYYESGQIIFLENQSGLQYVANSPTETTLTLTGTSGLQRGSYVFRPAADQNLRVMPAVSKPGAVVLSAENDADTLNTPLEIRATTISITAGLTLGGNRYVCIDASGMFFSSTVACV